MASECPLEGYGRLGVIERKAIMGNVFDSRTGQLVIYKDRTNVVPVSLGYDVSSDTITSEIREDDDVGSDLIATWEVSFLTDGTDGELVFTLDDAVTALITKSSGFMDIKRVSSGEPFNVFDKPLEVIFRDSVTL